MFFLIFPRCFLSLLPVKAEAGLGNSAFLHQDALGVRCPPDTCVLGFSRELCTMNPAPPSQGGAAALLGEQLRVTLEQGREVLLYQESVLLLV